MLSLISKALPFLIFLFVVSNLQAQEKCEEHLKYGAPSQATHLLCRLGYAQSYNEGRKVADWVEYHLTREKANGAVERSDDFRPDPDLAPNIRAELSDYRRSGFDRGHLAPAGDMQWSEQAMSESFLLSNMAPQVGVGFNQGIWKTLEEKVRQWARSRGELYIMTGPIYIGDRIDTIGTHHVAVPTHFYKVVFDPVRVDAIAFILPNMKLKSRDLPHYVTSVDTVEMMTDLDFLPELEDTVEAVVEGKLQVGMWE